MMNSNLADGEAIGSKWLSKAIETAQKKVEARNYEARKQVVQFDDVMNDQRKVIYEQRAEIMDSETVDDVMLDMRHDTINAMVTDHCPPGSYPEQWDLEGLKERIDEVLNIPAPIESWIEEDGIDQSDIEERLAKAVDEKMEKKIAATDASIWRSVEKSVLLQRLDHHWKEHLATLDALRTVVFLRAHAQKQPINEYKREAFGLFENMLDDLREDVTKILATNDIRVPPPATEDLPDLPDFLTGHIDPLTGRNDAAGETAGAAAMMAQLGAQPQGAEGEGDDPYAGMNLNRNAPCPCGSGAKYKHCHGKAG